MTSGIKTSFRIVPARGPAIFRMLFCLLFVLAFGLSMFVNGGTVSVNGVVVTGVEREQALAEMRLVFGVVVLLFLLAAVWQALVVFAESPWDHVTIGPDGLSVIGLFGRRHRSWEEMDRFVVRIVPLHRPPIAWVTAKPRANARAMRFFLTGYIRIKFFSDLGRQSNAVADWLDQVAAAYTRGTVRGTLPEPPWEFNGRIVEQTGVPLRSDASVINRR